MMKPMLISMTVLSALTFSSCGKSKDSKKSEPIATKTQPAPTTTSTDPQFQPGAPVPTVGDGAADVGLNSPVNSPLPAAPTGRPADRGQSGTSPVGRVGVPVIGENSQAEAQTNNSSVLRPPLMMSKESSAVDLKFDEIEAVKTGGKAQGLNYTSAGCDGLMAEFRLKSKTVSGEQQTMNQNLAGAILSAKLRRVTATGEIFIDLTVDEFGKIQIYKMKAINGAGRMTLSAVSASGDLEFQGGFLKCTDLDNGCENTYAKIKFSGAYTRIIFRNSYADHNYMLYKNEQAPMNLNFDLWSSYILNKTNSVQTSAKIDYVQVSSFEVVNGKSGMGVLLMTQDQDMLGLSVPLLAADKGSMVMASVTKLSDISKNYDLNVLATKYTQKLSRALTDVKLVANNGLGQIRLELSFSAQSTDSKIWMTLSRVEKPTLSVLDVQKFEATLPKF